MLFYSLILKVKMLKYLKFLCLVVSFVSLQSCIVPAVALIYAINLTEGKKDVSSNFKRGHVINKKYELLQNVRLYQFTGKDGIKFNGLHLIEFKLASFAPGVLSINKTIPKGTRFKVRKVEVKTSCGNEQNYQYIFASFIDINDKHISQKNFEGKEVFFSVENLFENTSQPPYIDWVFLPKQGVIKEIFD